MRDLVSLDHLLSEALAIPQPKDDLALVVLFLIGNASELIYIIFLWK